MMIALMLAAWVWAALGRIVVVGFGEYTENIAVSDVYCDLGECEINNALRDIGYGLATYNVSVSGEERIAMGSFGLNPNSSSPMCIGNMHGVCATPFFYSTRYRRFFMRHLCPCPPR